jgi:hypothetical protein
MKNRKCMKKRNQKNGKGKMKILKNKNLKIGGAIFIFPFFKFHTFTNFHMFYKYNATLIFTIFHILI